MSRIRKLLLVSILAVPSVASAQAPPAPSSCEIVRNNFASQIGMQATQLMDLEKLVVQCRQELATEKAKHEEKKDATLKNPAAK